MGKSKYDMTCLSLKMVRLLLAMLLLLHGIQAVFAAQPQGVIDEIRFSGNKVTRESVMRQEMLISEGDPVDLGRIDRSRQAIMNLGLFKSVEAEMLQEDGKNVLLISVDERFYILPLPLLDGKLEEKEYSYGFELRHDNLMGLNQRLKITYENNQSVDSDIPVRKEASFSYSYPRINGTVYNLSLSGKVVRTDVEERDADAVTGTYQFDSRSLGFHVSRWLSPELISEGWLIGAGMGVGQQIYQNQTGTALIYDDSQSLEVNFGIDYSTIQEFPFHREGSAYGYGAGLALTGMGSDYSYNRHLFYHRNYLALQRVDANINTQLKVGLANGNVTAFSIGGGSSLRGYEGGVAVGNAMFQLNTEYHHHLSGYRQLRGVVFADVGNAWPGVLEVDFGKLFTSVGLGVRWRVQAFVDLTLRVDAAYALDTEATKVYATTSSSF